MPGAVPGHGRGACTGKQRSAGGHAQSLAAPPPMAHPCRPPPAAVQLRRTRETIITALDHANLAAFKPAPPAAEPVVQPGALARPALPLASLRLWQAPHPPALTLAPAGGCPAAEPKVSMEEQQAVEAASGGSGGGARKLRLRL